LTLADPRDKVTEAYHNMMPLQQLWTALCYTAVKFFHLSPAHFPSTHIFKATKFLPVTSSL